MKRAAKWGLASTLLLATGCASLSSESQLPAAPQPAKTIDAARFYTGRWYEIGRTPLKLTAGCVAGTTDYYRDADGRLIDRDACRVGDPAGKEKLFEGPVTILDPATNAKVSVSYRVWSLFHVSRTYWMLDRGDDYSWFIVSDPAFRNISLFTRSPRPSQAEVAALTARAKALGYDVGKLEYPAQFPPGQGAP